MKLHGLFGGKRGRAIALAGAFWLALAGVMPRLGAAEAPAIQGIEQRGGDLVIRVAVPAGIARVVLEGCEREDLKAWVPRAVARVESGATEVVFTLPAGGGMQLFRARADATDPLPAAFYSGKTNFVGTPASDPTLLRNLGGVPVFDAAATAPEAGAEPRGVVESDIWVVRGDTLYFFNQYRGLQIIDIADPDAPLVKGTFSLPGAGEQMYLQDERYAVLLAHDPCHQWGTDAESAVIVVDTQVQPPAELAHLPLRGRIVESRMVGEALYVATETWEPVSDGSGAWRSGTLVTGIDFADPQAPKVQPTLWFPGSGNVVTASDRFLFVAVTDYSTQWPWKSDLQVVDITAPDGTLAAHARIPLAGRVADKFKIDLLDDVLRVVVESLETRDNGRVVTVLETLRLPDPRSAAPFAYARLDRLELARGERLFATRFDGQRGYIVTFLRIDPLWVIDLSDPTDLKVVGELEIPGWSTFMRPLGDRLLTLGIDNVGGWRVAVQLFDVSNPAKPALLAKVPLGEDSSWSEANQDEKAFGIFPEAGLLLVPVSEWKTGGGVHGVQLLDLGRDSLVARGFLASDDVVPRRAAWHKDRVFTVSGRQMVAADVRDRDHPVISAEVELAYPVERVVVAGTHVLEFQSGAIRARPVQGGDVLPAPVALTDLPVLGATLRGDQLHLLQGRAAEVVWEPDPATKDAWNARTNAGVLLASVWDASALPALVKRGEHKAPTSQTWLPNVKPLWVGDDLLVWATVTGGGPWRGGWGGPMVDVALPVGGRGIVGDVWWPWWYGGPRVLFGVRIGAAGQPEIVSETAEAGSGEAVGEALSAGGLVFATRQVHESDVVGTNAVVEQAWFPTVSWRTNEVKLPDGGVTNQVVEVTDGEWRVVTNSYPVLQWWSRYELDVVDYTGDAARPVQRPAVRVPGSLLGTSHEGALLYTTASRNIDAKGGLRAWLEASAYDGVAAHLVDGLAVADFDAGEAFAAAFANGRAYVARGGWGDQQEQRLEVWSLDATGRWARDARTPMSAPPGELKVFGDLLLGRNGSAFELFGLTDPGQPQALPVVQPPGCFGGDFDRADGDSARGLWLPLWDYGAVRLGP